MSYGALRLALQAVFFFSGVKEAALEDSAFPTFHFNLASTPSAVLRINDPNGVQYWEGAYHYPFQWKAGAKPVDIAHAVSDDLLHWRILSNPALQPTPGTKDAEGVWSGGGFRLGGSGRNVTSVGLMYRTRPGPGIAGAVASDPNLTSWRKLGVLFPAPNGDGLPAWRTSPDGKWHGGGSQDLPGAGGVITYTSMTDRFGQSASDWRQDGQALFTVSENAPNWPGFQCCCPEFFPGRPTFGRLPGTLDFPPVGDQDVRVRGHGPATHAYPGLF